METDNYCHASMKSAQLRSADARYLIEFVLRPLTEWKHQNWHSYELHMVDTSSGKMASLISTENHTLFLDKVIEPEIPALCAGLRMIVSTGNPYKFEPIDERDFRLDAVQEAQGIRVKIQYDSVPASAEHGWPAGLIVDRAELLRFTDDLESAFNELMADPNARLLP